MELLTLQSSLKAEIQAKEDIREELRNVKTRNIELEKCVRTVCADVQKILSILLFRHSYMSLITKTLESARHVSIFSLKFMTLFTSSIFVADLCRDVEGKKILIKAHEESLLGKDQEIARLKEQSFKSYDWGRASSKEEIGSSRKSHM